MTDPRGIVDCLRRHGDRMALAASGRELSYAQLAAAVAAVATRLGPVRRLVAVLGRNDIDSLVGYLGALAGGHAVLLLAPAGDSTELLDRYPPDVVIDGATLHERHPGTRHRLHPDLALLLSTSGSTGSPKLVRLSAANLAANAEAIARYLDLTADDRAITGLPISYCYGLSVVHSHLLRGGGLIVTDSSVLDDEFWELFERYGATGLAGVPYTFELLDRAGFDARELPRLRYLTQAGGKMEPDRVRRYAELGARRGWQLFVMYGATEATARMAYLPPEFAATRPETIGRPIPGGAFTLAPVDGWPGDDVGELVYHGPNVMLGYAEAADDLALGRTVEELRTGDIARRDPDGLYRVVGRRSRFVKLFGLRIDLQRVEAAVAETGTRALCTDDGAALLVAVETGADPNAVARVAAGTAGIPQSAVRVLVFDELPRLPNGKPDHQRIRERASAAPATATVGVRALFADVLRPAAGLLDDRSTFVGLGGDSLTYVAMSVRLERLLGHLPAGWHTMTVAELERAARPARGTVLGATLETSVALRAAAIVLVVCAHTALFRWWGGAHVLLAVAGYNFGRFCLTDRPRTVRARHLARTAGAIALPAICWIALIMPFTDDYGWTNLLLLQKLLGPYDSPTAGHLWFIEVLVWLLAIAAGLLVVRAVDRWERAAPYGVAWAVLLAGLLVRFTPVGAGAGARYTLLAFWFFALGWVAAKATTTARRLAVSLALLVGIIGYFGDPWRELLVGAGIVLLIWLPGVRCPAVLAILAGVVAEASLYIYLTHWQVFPLFGDRHLLAVPAAIAVGVGCARVGRAIGHRAARVVGHRVARVVRPRAAAARPLAGRGQAPNSVGPTTVT